MLIATESSHGGLGMDSTSELAEERTRSKAGAELRRARVDHDMTLPDEPDSTDTDVCPYPGLASFGLAETHWFFGRKPDTDAVIDQLAARLAGGVPLAVVAPSGAGKSSLLAAGLVPALADGALPGSQDWPVVVTTPGMHPLTTLAARIAELIGADPAEAAAATADPERFAAFLTSPGGRQWETYGSARVVLIVDQFEEIFAEFQEPERQAFIAALCTAARSAGVLIILGVRADFYGSCLAYPALVPALRSPVLLEPMRADQLRSIITGPAEAENFEVEPGLVELLLRDLGVADGPGVVAASYDPGALPLLAHTLRATWQRRSGRLLTVAGYRRTGGLREAITTTAERVYTRLNQAEQQIAQQLLVRLVQVSEQTGALRRRVPRDRLVQALPAPAEETEKILETFGRARLLTLDTTSVEITHEALLWAWPRLAEWINADRAGLRIHQMLSEAAEAWEAEDRDPARLYRDRPLAIAQDWAAGPGRKDQLSALEAAYLQASIEQTQHEQQAERRRTRRLRTLVGVLAMALVVALLAGIIAFQLSLEMDRQRRLATATELAVSFYSVVTTHPDMAMLMAVEAHHLAKNEPKTRSALLSAQSHYFAGLLAGHTGPINTVKFSPDGSMLATASDDGTVRLWDAADHHLITTLLDHRSGPAHDAEFSPDGSMLATASHDGIVRLWNVARRQLSGTLGTPSDASGATGSAVTSITFSHDSGILATASNRDEARLWDVKSGRQITTLPDPIEKVAFSKVGPILATVSRDGVVSLWKVDKSDHPTPLGLPLAGPTGGISSVVFSPDGRTLATGSLDRVVRLWDVAAPTQPKPLDPPLAGPTAGINSVVFSRDGKTLVTGSGDGTAWLWDVSTRRTTGTFTSHNGSVNSVALNHDEDIVATAGDDHIVRLWDKRGPILSPSSPMRERDRDVELSPDERFLATAGPDGVRLWDVINRSQIAMLPGRIQSTTFSEDSRILATVDDKKTVRLWELWELWDTANHRPLVTLLSQTPQVASFSGKKVAFSPHEGILAIVNSVGKNDNPNSVDKNTVQLWDVANLAHPTPLGPPLPVPADSLITDMAFSRGGRILMIAGTDDKDTFGQLWDVGNPRQPTPFVKSLERPVPHISKMMFTSDDRILITTDLDGTVQRWEVDTGQLLSTQEISSLPGGRVRPIGLNFHGKLATIDESEGGSAIKLWDTVSAQPIPWATLTGHADRINDAALSRDGRLLATVSKDGTVRIWDLDPVSVTNRLCRIIGTVSEEQKDRWGSFVSSGFPDKPACG